MGDGTKLPGRVKFKIAVTDIRVRGARAGGV
jgi:hypothetical protein